jgi:O-antigen/teichoic acid export membrane protein
VSADEVRLDDAPGQVADPAAEEHLEGGEIRRRAATGVVSFMVRGLGTKLLGAIGTLVLARLLTPKEFGAIAFGTTLIAIGSLIADGGMASALIRRKEEPRGEELRAMLGFHLLLMTGSALLVAAIGIPFGRPGLLAAIMAVALPLDALRVPNGILLERRLKYNLLVWTDLTEVLVWNTVAVALVALGMGVWGVAIAGPLRALAASVVLLTIGPLSWIRPRFALRTVRPFLRFGLKVQLTTVVSTIGAQGMNLAIAAVAGLAILGIWNLTITILSSVMLLYFSLWRVSFPAIARLIDAGEAAQPIVARALLLTSATTGLLAVGLGGTAPASVPLLFGPSWHAVAPLVAWTALGLLVGAPVSTAATGYFNATNRPGIPLRATLLYTLIPFAVSLPLLNLIGSEGIGIGACVAGWVDGLALSWYLRKDGIAVAPLVAPPAVIAIVTIAAGWLIANNVQPHVMGLLAAGFAVVVMYLGGLFVVRRHVLMELVSMLRRHVLTRSTLRGVVAD